MSLRSTRCAIRPCASRAISTSGTTAASDAPPKARPGLGSNCRNFAQHVGEILVIDVAHAFEARKFAARDQIEIVDQPRHARIVAVQLFRLQCQAFG